MKLNGNNPYAKMKHGSKIVFPVYTNSVEIRYLKKDNNLNNYIRLVEVSNTNNIMDDTIRIIKNGKNVGVVQIEQELLYQPNKFISITDNGEIYQMLINEDYLTVSKLKWIKFAKVELKEKKFLQ